MELYFPTLTYINRMQITIRIKMNRCVYPTYKNIQKHSQHCLNLYHIFCSSIYRTAISCLLSRHSIINSLFVVYIMKRYSNKLEFLFPYDLIVTKGGKAYWLIPGYRVYEYEVQNNRIARVHNYTISIGFIKCSNGVFLGIRMGVGELHTA